MRVESVDEVEILRRMEEGIYNQEEYEKALAWTQARIARKAATTTPTSYALPASRRMSSGRSPSRCTLHHQGSDSGQSQAARAVWGGNAWATTRIAAGFQGQRQWTDHWPNCDYPEAVLNSIVRLCAARRSLSPLPPRTTCLNAVSACCSGNLLTNQAQRFRRRTHLLVAPRLSKRVTGCEA